MTQAELAERSAVSLSTVRRFENGEYIGLARMLQLMDALVLGYRIDLLVPDQSSFPDKKTRRRARRKNPRRPNGMSDGGRSIPS